MRGPHNLWRLIRTGATFERTGAMTVALEAMEIPPRLRSLPRLLGWPFKWLGLKGDPALPPVTRALTALGPAYIKFGQVLSTRPDIVGNELSEQLKYLQDKLPPFPLAQARAAVEAELGLLLLRGLFRIFRTRRRRLDRAGPPGAAGRTRARRSRSRSCVPGSNAPSAATSTPSILRRAGSRRLRLSHAGCARST
jgi:hypothetical protein